MPHEIDADAPQPGQPSRALLYALERILLPIVRLLIFRSVPFPVATEVLRSLYVRVAADEFAVPGKKQTDSRVHLLTGVHRKDVRRLRERQDQPAGENRRASLTAQVIAHWTTMEPFRNADGDPLVLPRTSENGESFESLVRAVSTDIRPRVVLDEWERLGLAQVDDDGNVTLRVDAFVPPKDSDEILQYLGRNAHDHVAAAVHNVIGDGEPFFERSMTCDQLSTESLTELRTLARTEGMDTLRRMNRRATELQSKDASVSDATNRVAFGAYFFAEDSAQTPNEENPS